MNQILKISEAALLAFHTVVYLAGNDKKRFSTKEISKVFKVSEAHLSKVLQRLTKVGIVKPVRGPKGGFSLAKPSSEISLLNIYESIDGPISDNDCLLGSYVCGGVNCIFGNLLREMKISVKKYLVEAKVSTLTDCFENMDKK